MKLLEYHHQALLFVLRTLILPKVSIAFSAAKGSPFCVNLSCHVKEDRRHDFLKLIRDNQKQTLETEDQALQYTVGEDVERANLFYIHEQFETPQGFDIHRETDHNANWISFKESDPFVEDPVTFFYHGTHEPKKFMDQKSAYCLNVELNVKPEFREEFLETIRQNAEGSNTLEPLCMQYVWGEDPSVANRFLFHEQYESKKGFQQHQEAPHFKVWERFASQNPFSKPPVVQQFETV